MKKTYLTCEDMERLLFVLKLFMDNTGMSAESRAKFQSIRLKLIMMRAETEYLNKRKEGV